jgi:hypothetical protein
MLSVPDPPADAMLDVLTFSVRAHRPVDGPAGLRTVVDEEPQPAPDATARNIQE